MRTKWRFSRNIIRNFCKVYLERFGTHLENLTFLWSKESLECNKSRWSLQLLQLHINILENFAWNKLLILIPVQYIHIHIFTQTKNFFQPHHEGLFSCKTLHMVFRNRLNVQHVEYSHIFAIWQTEL